MTRNSGRDPSASSESTSSVRWRQTLLAGDATLEHAIRVLDETAFQIVLVVSPDGTLLGTLTDGDIRRGLLRGFELRSRIDAVMEREPLVVPPAMSRESSLQLMQVNRIRHLPVVDEQRRVVGLHLLDDLLVPTRRPNRMVIMAGGEGSRLRPSTETCPKPLLRVGGKPMLEHIIVRAKSEGFVRFSLAICYLGRMIEDYFGDGSRWEVEISYLREEIPLGTAGAIGLLTPRPNEPIVVSNGDVLTDIRYGEMLDFHSRHGAAGTMAVRVHEWQHPFGVVRTKGVDIVGFAEKPIARSYINAGIYVLDHDACDVLDPGEKCDMPTLFDRLRSRAARTIVYPMHEPWLDVGNESDLRRAEGVRAGRRPRRSQE